MRSIKQERWPLIFAALLLAIVAGRGLALGQETAGGGPVSIPITAVDKEGRVAESLKSEDLRVFADGVEQKIDAFSQQRDEPLHVVVMIDASASQEHILPSARRAAVEFISSSMRQGRDDAAVVSFTGVASVRQELTSDLSAARRAIGSVEFVPPPGYAGGGIVVAGRPPPKALMVAGSTALWDSLIYVCEHVLSRAVAKGGRRAVVIVTDGVDTSSSMKADSAIERLIRDGVAVYAVGIGDDKYFDELDRSALRKVSERTGGRALFPRKSVELPDAFERIGRELLSKYVVTFTPGALKHAPMHKLRIELVNPALRKEGVELAYPQGFSGDARRP